MLDVGFIVCSMHVAQQQPFVLASFAVACCSHTYSVRGQQHWCAHWCRHNDSSSSVAR